MGLFLTNEIQSLYLGNEEVDQVYLGSEKIWPIGYPIGQTFNFEYTGTVQEIELLPGRYKLQCWGAKGGNSYATSSGAGSRGGYSEGVLTLNETKTVYVFVGGAGSRGSGSSLVNGGWNGGGASVGYSSYNSSGTYGYSYPACGGGATDMALVSSTMSYSSGRTNRSSESLLSRFIVAGGGAGGGYRYTETETTTITGWEEIYSGGESLYWIDGNGKHSYYWDIPISYIEEGQYYKFVTNAPTEDFYQIKSYFASYSATVVSYISQSKTYTNSIQFIGKNSSNIKDIEHSYRYNVEKNKSDFSFILYRGISTTSTSTDSSYSGNSKQGGGTSGRGQYPGTQSSGGSGNSDVGGFGYGGNQTITNYRYISGGGGGGWYGGGTAYSDTSTSYIGYTGGGSGFVNIASNSSYRPSGYTGLQLDSGTTYQGNSSFPNTAGTGNETGHNSSGYAKITVIE